MFGLKKMNLVMAGILTVLFILAAYPFEATAFMSDGGTPFRLMGTIVAFDPADNLVTVADINNVESSFVLNDEVDIMKCYGTALKGDLEIGDVITLGYSDASNGTRIVSWIDLENVTC